MVAKTGLVVPSKDGVSRKTGGSPIGRALKSCTIGVFTNGIDADFFCLFIWIQNSIPLNVKEFSQSPH